MFGMAPASSGFTSCASSIPEPALDRPTSQKQLAILARSASGPFRAAKAVTVQQSESHEFPNPLLFTVRARAARHLPGADLFPAALLVGTGLPHSAAVRHGGRRG